MKQRITKRNKWKLNWEIIVFDLVNIIVFMGAIIFICNNILANSPGIPQLMFGCALVLMIIRHLSVTNVAKNWITK